MLAVFYFFVSILYTSLFNLLSIHFFLKLHLNLKVNRVRKMQNIYDYSHFK